MDLFLLGTIILVGTISALLAYYAINQVANVGDSVGISLGLNSTNRAIITGYRTAGSNFVNTLPYVFIAVGLSTVILASFIPVSPIFLPIGILFLILATALFLQVQNSITALWGTGIFVSLAAQFPLPVYIAQNVGYVVFVFGLILLVVVYGRINRSGGLPDG